MKYIVLFFSLLGLGSDFQIYSVCPSHLDLIKDADCRYTELPKSRKKTLVDQKLLVEECKDAKAILGDRRCLSEVLKIGDFRVREDDNNQVRREDMITESIVEESRDLGKSFIKIFLETRNKLWKNRHH